MPPTLKQAAFVREYLVDLNATQAAVRAGYSPRTARQQGQRLLTKVDIAVAIERAFEERSKRTGITSERVLDELAKLAFSNLLDYFRLTDEGEPAIDLSGITPEQAAALTEIQVDDYVDGRGEDARDVRRVKIKTADKLKALEMLARHLGLFSDKQDDQEALSALRDFVAVMKA